MPSSGAGSGSGHVSFFTQARRPATSIASNDTRQACHPELPKPRSGGGQRGIPRTPRGGGGFLAALHPSGVPPARNDSVTSRSHGPSRSPARDDTSPRTLLIVFL